MFEAVEGLVTERHQLEQQLADPATHADQGLAKRLNQRYAEVSAIVRTWKEWRRLGDDAEAARELAADDPAFAEEAESLTARREGWPSGCATCWYRATRPTPRTRCSR
jgi:peptide chain release factor 1